MSRNQMITVAKNGFLKPCLLHKVMGARWCPELLLNYSDTVLGNVSPKCSLMLLHFRFLPFSLFFFFLNIALYFCCGLLLGRIIELKNVFAYCVTVSVFFPGRYGSSTAVWSWQNRVCKYHLVSFELPREVLCSVLYWEQRLMHIRQISES